MKCHFYIIYSKKFNRYYIGNTGNLHDRLSKHNSNHQGYTGKTNDWEIMYVETFPTKEEAYARERQVKKWKSRKRIIALIDKGTEHPDL